MPLLCKRRVNKLPKTVTQLRHDQDSNTPPFYFAATSFPLRYTIA